MKIAVDVLSIRPDGSAGGATGFALELIKGFSQQEKVDVLVLCADWNIDYLKKILPDKVEYCQMSGERRYTGIVKIDRIINRILNHFRKNDLLADKGVDILYCPFSAATFKTKGIPTVSTILDIQHEYYPQFFAPEELLHRRKFYQDIVKKVEKVTCISDYTKKTFCEKYGYPEDRAKTIYIAIQNRFSKKDDTILEKLNIFPQKYIVYPANFWEHKNHKLLLNAFAMYSQSDHNELKLVLTGNPLKQGEYYQKMLETMGINEKVIITGYLTNEELYSILDNAKGLIYPSLFEGFGIPVVEAMYLNKLIASSNLTSLPEIGCDSIFYFNPKKPDEIVSGIECLVNAQMTNKIREEYKRKLQDYEPDKMVKAYIDVFKETIENKADLIFDEEIEGMYPDGWTAEVLYIQLKNRSNMEIQGRIVHPEFLRKKQKLYIEIDGRKKEYILNPGENIEIKEKIMSQNAVFQIRVKTPWTPQKELNSDDLRKLGVMVDNLRLVGEQEIIDIKEMV